MSGDTHAYTTTSTIKTPRESTRQEGEEQPPWVALGRLFTTLHSGSFPKESPGKLRYQALKISRAYHIPKPKTLPLTRGYNQLAPHLNVRGFPPDPTSRKLWTLTSLALCNYKAGAELSVDTANALRYSDITLN